MARGFQRAGTRTARPGGGFLQ